MVSGASCGRACGRKPDDSDGAPSMKKGDLTLVIKAGAEQGESKEQGRVLMSEKFENMCVWRKPRWHPAWSINVIHVRNGKNYMTRNTVTDQKGQLRSACSAVYIALIMGNRDIASSQPWQNQTLVLQEPQRLHAGLRWVVLKKAGITR